MAKLGIIAEDKSDIETLRVFIKRITHERFKIKSYSAEGCGKLIRKCGKITKIWKSERFTHVIICHDLDSNDRSKYKKLYYDLNNKTSSFPDFQNNKCILIPIEEIEAWFLSDIDCLKRILPGLKLKEIAHPEKVSNPKEYIAKLSKKKSKPRYINTIHNPIIADSIEILKIRKKCPEFDKFYKFVIKIA